MFGETPASLASWRNEADGDLRIICRTRSRPAPGSTGLSLPSSPVRLASGGSRPAVLRRMSATVAALSPATDATARSDQFG